jgi:hypothetical protein
MTLRKKRVSRALQRLREFFAKRGIALAEGGLAVVISANAVQAAPVGLAIAISASLLAGTAASSSTVIAVTRTAVSINRPCCLLQKALNFGLRN